MTSSQLFDIHCGQFCLCYRRSWDRNLVSKDLDLLDNTISMFNVVRVCVFCAQYFDPDFPGGIAAPQRQLEIDPKSSVMAKFFDQRYPSTQVAGHFLKDSSAKQTRERARTAVKQQAAIDAGASGFSSNKDG
jgi:hypothetical protein